MKTFFSNAYSLDICAEFIQICPHNMEITCHIIQVLTNDRWTDGQQVDNLQTWCSVGGEITN